MHESLERRPKKMIVTFELSRKPDRNLECPLFFMHCQISQSSNVATLGTKQTQLFLVDTYGHLTDEYMMRLRVQNYNT